MNREQLTETAAKVAQTAAVLLEMPQTQALKAKIIPYDNVIVSEKVTAKNFYKNGSFWTMFGVAVASGVTGDYFGTLSAVLNFIAAL